MIVWASFDNGTAVQLPVPVDQSLDSAVHIEVGSTGVLGEWKSTGSKFEGTSIEPGSQGLYTVTVDNEAIGVHGTLRLKAVRCDCNLSSVEVYFQLEQLIVRVESSGTLSMRTQQAWSK